MLRYSARASLLPELYVGVLGLLSLLWLVDRWPQQLWQLTGVAVALAGAVGGSLFDEPAASVVDTLPRPRWWRTAARVLPVALLVLLWLVAASLVDPRGIGRTDVLQLQGAGSILIGVALATWLRRRGHPTPGLTVASTLLLVLTFAAAMNPVDGELPLFPYGPGGDWATSRLLWVGMLTMASVAVAVSCTEGLTRSRAGISQSGQRWLFRVIRRDLGRQRISGG